MKKVLCVLAAAAMIACGATSCKKECTCTVKKDGQTVAENIKVETKGSCAKATVNTSAYGTNASVTCK